MVGLILIGVKVFTGWMIIDYFFQLNHFNCLVVLASCTIFTRSITLIS